MGTLRSEVDRWPWLVPRTQGQVLELCKRTRSRRLGTRIKVLEQAHLGRPLRLHVVPFVPGLVFCLHCAANVVSPHQVDVEELVVRH